MNGAFVVNKPAGMSSAHVVRLIKKKFNLARVGHAGTLDPFATGVLLVLLGKGTKLQPIFLNGAKAYRGEILLGVETDSHDLTGVVKREVVVSVEGLSEKVAEFERQLFSCRTQLPPQISAISISGKRSYKMARLGEEVLHKERAVEVYEFSLSLLVDNLISYHLKCSKGFYVRSMARDLGDYLGVGASVKSLERVFSEPFSLAGVPELDDLLEMQDVSRYLIGMEQLVTGLPSFIFSDKEIEKLRQGKQNALKRISSLKFQTGALSSVFSDSGEFVALLQCFGEGWKIRFVC